MKKRAGSRAESVIQLYGIYYGSEDLDPHPIKRSRIRIIEENSEINFLIEHTVRTEKVNTGLL